MQGNGPVSRKLKISNQSNVPIEIAWKALLIEKHDEKLIDVNLSYDNPKSEIGETNKSVSSTRSTLESSKYYLQVQYISKMNK
jgi:hypothetical protein